MYLINQLIIRYQNQIFYEGCFLMIKNINFYLGFGNSCNSILIMIFFYFLLLHLNYYFFILDPLSSLFFSFVTFQGLYHQFFALNNPVLFNYYPYTLQFVETLSSSQFVLIRNLYYHNPVIHTSHC